MNKITAADIWPDHPEVCEAFDAWDALALRVKLALSELGFREGTTLIKRADHERFRTMRRALHHTAREKAVRELHDLEMQLELALHRFTYLREAAKYRVVQKEAERLTKLRGELADKLQAMTDAAANDFEPLPTCEACGRPLRAVKSPSLWECANEHCERFNVAVDIGGSQ